MYKTLILFIFISFGAIASSGGITLDVSRVVFDSQNNSQSFTMKNTSSQMVLLIRATANNYYSNDNKDVPFFITPPLNRIEPNSDIQFRINKLDSIERLPKDRESLFAINVLAIPPKKEKTEVQMALNTKIKLIYRPREINDPLTIEHLQDKLILSKNKSGIRIENPTPYFVTIANFKFNNLNTNRQPEMIKPFSDIILRENNINSMSFSIINDFGGNSASRNISF
ncbi:molecular chaperone [Escherichia coli]|uniref:fimbrial biogenesis chaperone n=1 Tax=Escherichia coli TaxID=562 RepID=UPI0003917A8E|nr:molecular chaperone [Escherichia coli]EFA4552979.1 molecular chaperone [Escherichia coli]EFH8258310.1 molecular chaperone [Escherichia coli]EFK7891736.1 molecular chaperone [Escherichia coli]EIH7474502.1 molecular chaperone [Escherichia coli]ELG8910641.1 molecular chaperone [Escherichia coli]